MFSFTERQIAEKYKKLTNIEPIVLTLMGPRDMILEFDKDDDVITLSTRAHGMWQWDDLGVNIHCIAAPKTHLLEIYREKRTVEERNTAIG